MSGTTPFRAELSRIEPRELCQAIRTHNAAVTAFQSSSMARYVSHSSEWQSKGLWNTNEADVISILHTQTDPTRKKLTMTRGRALR